MRADLDPDGVAVATFISHAAAAEIDKRWPDLPAKAYALLREYRTAEAERMNAEHKARLENAKGPRRGA